MAGCDHGREWDAAMRAGDYPRAWDVSAAVRAASDPAQRDDPRLPYHQRWVWDGRPFHGRPVLVRCYHGLGDTLQFARYLPALRTLVASLTVEVQPALLPLLSAVPGIDRLIPFDPARPAPAAECDLEIMELAAALRVPPEALPPPYLRAPPGPAAPEGAIGLCWEAGGWNPDRSVPPALLAPLLRHRCLSLHPRPTALPVLNPGGCPEAVADTARLMASLPLVVTVDTMVAHLAGALGRPTWLLLKHAADWRWRDTVEDCAWYPSTRLFRQPAPGDWATVIAQVAAALDQRP